MPWQQWDDNRSEITCKHYNKWEVILINVMQGCDGREEAIRGATTVLVRWLDRSVVHVYWMGVVIYDLWLLCSGVEEFCS